MRGLILCFSLLHLVSASFAAPRGHGVGNGADGYFFASSGKVILREIYEEGLQNMSWPVHAQHSRFRERAFFILESEIERTMMASKLLSINIEIPGFADAMVAVADQIKWTFIAAPLTPIDYTGDEPSQFAGAEHRQIAIRLGREVHIHRDSWDRMSAENRIALLFHECIEAMLPEIRRTDGYQEQSSSDARKLTSRLFQNSLHIAELFYRKLPHAWSELESYGKSGPATFRVQLIGENGILNEWTHQLGGPVTVSELKERICSFDLGTRTQLRVIAKKAPFKLEWREYLAHFGPQNRSIIVKRHTPLRFEKSVHDFSSDCAGKTSLFLKQIFLEI